MFSQLCKARLWSKHKQKKAPNTSSETEKSSLAAEDEPKQFPSPPDAVLSVKPSSAKTSSSGLSDLCPSPVNPACNPVTVGVSATKNNVLIKKNDTATKHTQLELYLSWLLKISESQKALPLDHHCACDKSSNSKSTDNPAYGINPPEEPSKTVCQKDGPYKKQVKPTTKLPQTVPKVLAETSEKKMGTLQASITHKEGSRIRVSISKPKLKREKSGRSDASSARSRLNSASSLNDAPGIQKQSIIPSENRIHKRRHNSKRRMNRLQHQQAIEEVVNMFGKQFSKALMVEMKNQPSQMATIQQTHTIRNHLSHKSFPKARENPGPSTTQHNRLSVETRKTDQRKPPTQEYEVDPQLLHASQDNPANVSMVIMQCSRFISHLRKEPPFKESSLPMGSLVTALYRDNEWLKIRTAHGMEGYIYATSCVPLGTLPKKRLLGPQTRYNPQLTILKEYIHIRESKLAISETKTKQLSVSKTRDNESTFSPESTSTLQKKAIGDPVERLRPSRYVMTRDYKGVGANALNLKKGDVVTVVKKEQEDWVLAKMDTGEFGYIPMSSAIQVGYI